MAPAARRVLRGAVGRLSLAPNGQVRNVYAADEIDAVAAYCEELDECYLVPIELVVGRRAIWLRLGPPKNGQRAGLNWAAEYELRGAVAQLGERLGGTQKATGSSPVSSTFRLYEAEASGSNVVGAHEFRNLFGLYAQRAAAGEDFLITRRGKPYVRLGPPRPQLSGATANGSAEPLSAADRPGASQNPDL